MFAVEIITSRNNFCDQGAFDNPALHPLGRVTSKPETDPLPKFFRLDHAGAFLDPDQAIGWNLGNLLGRPVGPADLQIGGRGVAQPEVQPQVVHGIEAGLAQHFLSLPLVAVIRRDPRADRAAIGFHADQFHFQPVMIAAHIVAQQRRRLVEIDDQDVDVAVIIEIAKRAAAAGMDGGYARPRLFDQLFKFAIPQVAENDARRLERIRGQPLLHFRIDAARWPRTDRDFRRYPGRRCRRPSR